MITDKYEEFCLSIVAGSGNAHTSDSTAFCGCVQYLNVKKIKSASDEQGGHNASIGERDFDHPEAVQLNYFSGLLTAGPNTLSLER